jgi:APA family basic amino acid/polyamine antiporter
MAAVESAAGGAQLHRSLGIGFGVAVSVGAMVGVGILRSPSLIAGHVPDVFLIAALWLIGGMHALLDANVLAELAVLYPRAGGPYVYARRAFGDFGGLIVGWTDWLNNTSGVAVLSVGCAEFASTIVPAIAGHITIIALALQLVFYLINMRGVRQGAWTQNITSLVKMVLLFAIIGAIFFAVPRAPAAPQLAPVSLLGIVLAYTLIVSAYSGWNAPAYFAEEKTDPAKQIPRALFTSVTLVTVLYVLFNLALARALPLAQLRATPLPAAAAMSGMFGQAAGALVAAVAILTALSCLNGGAMMASRVLFGLSRDRLFLAAGARVNPGGSPYVALLVTALFSALIAATGTFETIFLMVGIFVVIVNVLNTASLFRLRVIEGALQRHYRTRGYPWLPLVALVLDGCLLVAFVLTNHPGALFGGALILLTVPVWLLLRRRRRAVGI